MNYTDFPAPHICCLPVTPVLAPVPSFTCITKNHGIGCRVDVRVFHFLSLVYLLFLWDFYFAQSCSLPHISPLPHTHKYMHSMFILFFLPWSKARPLPASIDVCYSPPKHSPPNSFLGFISIQANKQLSEQWLMSFPIPFFQILFFCLIYCWFPYTNPETSRHSASVCLNKSYLTKL